MHAKRLRVRLKMLRFLLTAKQAVLIVDLDGKTRYLWDCESLKAKKELLVKDLCITEEQDLS